MTNRLYNVSAYNGATFNGVRCAENFSVLAVSEEDAVKQAKGLFCEKFEGIFRYPEYAWARHEISVSVSPWDRVRHENAAIMEADCYDVPACRAF